MMSIDSYNQTTKPLDVEKNQSINPFSTDVFRGSLLPFESHRNLGNVAKELQKAILCNAQ